MQSPGPCVPWLANGLDESCDQRARSASRANCLTEADPAQYIPRGLVALPHLAARVHRCGTAVARPHRSPAGGATPSRVRIPPLVQKCHNLHYRRSSRTSCNWVRELVSPRSAASPQVRQGLGLIPARWRRARRYESPMVSGQISHLMRVSLGSRMSGRRAQDGRPARDGARTSV